MRRALAVLLLLAVTGPWGLSASAAGPGCSFDSCSKGQPTQVAGSGTDRGSYLIEFYHADGSAQAFTALEAHQGDSYQWMWTPACQINNKLAVQQCLLSLQACPVPGDVRYWVYYTDLSLNPPDSWHRLPSSYCLGPQPTISLAAIQADVQRQFRNLPLPRGSVHVQPPDRAVVNIPVIAYTDTPASKTFTVTALGASVTLTAHPTAWAWQWGAGLTSSTSGPGLPYPSCDGPAPDCAAYTFHAPGTFGPVSVTVSWVATYTVAGFTQTFSINDPVLVTTSGPALAVAQAPPVLVRS